MTEYDFWQAVYVATIRAGKGTSFAVSNADSAVRDLRARDNDSYVVGKVALREDRKSPSPPSGDEDLENGC